MTDKDTQREGRLTRIRRRAARLRGAPARVAELLGLGLVAGGVAMIYLPAAVIIAGAGLTLWAQGARITERGKSE